MFLWEIRQWYYKRGKRPKAGSILYSPILDIAYGHRDAFIRATSTPDVVRLWEDRSESDCIGIVQLNEEILSDLRGTAVRFGSGAITNWDNADHGAMDIRMAFCPLCGARLQRMFRQPQSKECPQAHGRAYITDNSDGSQAIIIFEPYGMD